MKYDEYRTKVTLDNKGLIIDFDVNQETIQIVL